MSRPLGPDAHVDVARDRFPYSIVWTPIPCITYLLPMIGHMGIANSAGVIHDFAGPYFVSVDNFAFGRPTRYLPLDVDKIGVGVDDVVGTWDQAVNATRASFEKQMYNFFCNNCHSMTANTLNRLKYKQRTNWNMVVLCLWMFVAGRFVNTRGVLLTLLPSLLVWGLILLFVFVF